MSFLNNDGLLYLWEKIKGMFATKSEVESLRNSMSNLGYGDMLKSTYDTNGNGIVDNAEKVNGKTVAVDVPANAKFTDTTYSNATSSAAGLMSGTDKSKLDDLPTATSLESTYAKKTDIAGVYKYKGSVASESGLPTTGLTTGDVYDIQAASSYGGVGMNVAWTGSKWDALGEVFSIDSITNAQIDSICS